jgi:hypothetical protein
MVARGRRASISARDSVLHAVESWKFLGSLPEPCKFMGHARFGWSSEHEAMLRILSLTIWI